jgi:hypothetical protein
MPSPASLGLRRPLSVAEFVTKPTSIFRDGAGTRLLGSGYYGTLSGAAGDPSRINPR